MEQYYILTGKFARKERNEPSAELDLKFYYQYVHDYSVLTFTTLTKAKKSQNTYTAIAFCSKRKS